MIFCSGILTCAGNGGRYARSVNQETPFPKHLQRVGSRTILDLAIESMRVHTPADEIIISIRPELKDAYIQEL